MPDLVTPTQRQLLSQADASSGFVTIRTAGEADPAVIGREAKEAAEVLIARRMLTFARREQAPDGVSVAWTYRLTPFGKSILDVLSGAKASEPALS